MHFSHELQLINQIRQAVRVRGDAGGEDVTMILLDAAGEQEAPARLLTNPAEKFYRSRCRHNRSRSVSI